MKLTHSSFQEGEPSGVNWREIWEHALQSARVVTALRIAQDDTCPQVIVVAAEGIAALLSCGQSALNIHLENGKISINKRIFTVDVFAMKRGNGLLRYLNQHSFFSEKSQVSSQPWLLLNLCISLDIQSTLDTRGGLDSREIVPVRADFRLSKSFLQRQPTSAKSTTSRLTKTPTYRASCLSRDECMQNTNCVKHGKPSYEPHLGLLKDCCVFQQGIQSWL